MVTRSWKIYGNDGAQEMAKDPSKSYDWSQKLDIRLVSILNSDITGTDEYSIIIITRNTEEECINELEGQLSDGLFENCKVGKVEPNNENDPRDVFPSSVVELLGMFDLSIAQLSRRFDIPYRTAQNWCNEGSNHRDCPDYVLKMMWTILKNEL